MEPEQLLWEAVRSNDIQTTKLLLKCGCRRSSSLTDRNINSSECFTSCAFSVNSDTQLGGCGCTSVLVNKSENGLCSFHLAVINNNIEMLILLVENGAILCPCSFTAVCGLDSDNLNFLEEFGPSISPLTLAVAFGDSKMVKYVFQIHQSLDLTALQLACKLSDLENVKVLLTENRKYTDINSRTDKTGLAVCSSPLLYAAKSNSGTEVIKLLLEHGSDVTVKDSEGNTPLHLAAMCGSEATVQLLLTQLYQVKASPCTLNMRDKSPFHLACKFGFCSILRLLLLHKCSINCDLTAKQDLLHEAAKYSQTNTIRLLLENGFSVNQFDSFAKTALFEAVKANNLEVVEVLLNANADPNIPRAPYESPILYAAEHSSPQIVEALLREGADVNTTDVVGVTPLIYAAKRCANRRSSHREDITALLLQYGADMTHKYLHTHTALSVAVACGNVECARILIEAGADIENGTKSGKLVLLHLAKNRECAELLLKNGLPVDYQNSWNKTALANACQEDNIEMAHLLMEYGADVSKMTKDGASPLFFAVSNDSILLVRDIIMAGACNVNDRVLVYFRSMLELALFLKASFQICQLLHLAGAVVTATFPSTCILHDCSQYLQFTATTVPRDAWHCKLWAKFRTKESLSQWDGLEDQVKVHSKMLTLEETCCHMLRKYLNFDKEAMLSLPLPQSVIQKLTMEIF